MKRLYTIAMAVAAVVTAQAVTPMQGKLAPKSVDSFGKVHPARAQVIGAKAQGKTAPMLKAKSRADEWPEDMIIMAEGRTEMMTVATTHFIDSWFGLMYIRESLPTQVVWGEDDTVYIRDIISGVPSGVYVKGELSGDKVTVKLPQYCYYEEYFEDDYYEFIALQASKMVLDEDEETYVNVAEEDNYVVYTVGEDGSLTLELNDGDPEDLDEPPMYIIGLCEDATPGLADWFGFGEGYQTYSKFDQEPVTAPDDVEFETWAMISNESGSVQVGFSGDKVYIKGFCPDLPEADEMTIVGTIDGDKAVFECPQYLGIALDNFIYLVACEWADDSWEECEMLDRLEMSYDAEGKVLSVDNPLIDLLFNVGTDDYNPLLYFEHPTFLYQSEEDLNADPDDPYVINFIEYEYRDYLDDYEGYIEWVIPSTNVKGFLLDTERMYYNFLINDEVVTFTAEDYKYIDEDITDIPYDFTDGYDIQAISDTRYITYKRADARTFGLQSFYEGSDGVLYKSNLVTFEPELTGISAVAGKSIKSVEYYNLQGQKVTNPTGGIYIMRNTYEDGTSSVCKVSKR